MNKYTGQTDLISSLIFQPNMLLHFIFRHFSEDHKLPVSFRFYLLIISIILFIRLQFTQPHPRLGNKLQFLGTQKY